MSGKRADIQPVKVNKNKQLCAIKRACRAVVDSIFVNEIATIRLRNSEML
jgi:hypothetical protein